MTKDGVPRACVANADHIATVPKDIVRDYLCTLEESRMQDLGRAIKFALDIP